MPFLGGGGTLASLADIDLTGVSPGDVLVYNAGGTWTPSTAPPPGPHTHDTSDVTTGVFVLDRLYNLTTVSTTDATPTTIATIVPGLNTSVQVKSFLQGRRTGGIAGSSGDAGSFERSFRIKNDGGTVTVSNLSSDFTDRDQSTWTIRAIVLAGNVLLQVIGSVDNNIDWQGAVRTFVV